MEKNWILRRNRDAITNYASLREFEFVNKKADVRKRNPFF